MKGLRLHALAASSDSPSTLAGFWDTVYQAYFGDLPEYSNINLGALGNTSLRLIIVGIFVGLALGGFVAAYNKQVLGRFVRHLIGEILLHETGHSVHKLTAYSRTFSFVKFFFP